MSGALADLASSINMRKTALVVAAKAFVSIVRAFKYMLVGTLCALLAISQGRECAAHWGSGIDSYMGIAAAVIRAVATKKMQACWDTVGRRVVGEVTGIAGKAGALRKIVFADSDLVRVVNETTMGSFGTGTCVVGVSYAPGVPTGCDIQKRSQE